jgi:hypothetical protein
MRNSRGMEAKVANIQRVFEEYFANWHIALPEEAIAHRTPGHVFERGWHIRFIWGEENGEEYFELLAQHRMTNDRHLRVYASGHVERLPAAPDFYVIPEGASEAETEQLRRAHQEEVRGIYADLREKGLLPPDRL